MTIDLDAIEARANATLSEYRSHTELDLRDLVREVVPALIAEVKRLRVDQAQGGRDYCELMERHDALHNRACKAEDEVKRLQAVIALGRQPVLIVTAPRYSTEAVDALLQTYNAYARVLSRMQGMEGLIRAFDVFRASREPAK